MSVHRVTYHRIGCDHRGCTTTTEPCSTPELAWIAFRLEDGMIFLPSRDRPLTYLCAAHHHQCADHYLPIPSTECHHCTATQGAR